jgi:CDP-glucose 4,6-dehydratase
MEGMVAEENIFRGRRILITGHTGFKGSWLTLWLHCLGAEISGLALDPLNDKDAYNAIRGGELCHDYRHDINDFQGVLEIVQKSRPEVVFHLAAQPLVLEAYRDPLYTLNTNIIGTANVLEACRHVDAVKAVIIVTTDKVYNNRESGKSFRENDRLGGNDIYSASKASAEIITEAYRNSFGRQGGFAMATVRAGNVIGGGDWSANRIIPDCVRAVISNKPVVIRNPGSVRPWQHVLEPLSGYLRLAERMLADPEGFNEAWNFGPGDDTERTVLEVARIFADTWGEGSMEISREQGENREAGVLKLDTEKSKARLGWRPKLSLEDAVRMTTEWYRAQVIGEDMRYFSAGQIKQYEEYMQ